MPLLAGLLLTLATGLVELLAKIFSQQIAVRVAFGALAVAGFGVLYLAIKAIEVAIAVSMPAGVVTALAFALPGNVSACVAAALAGDAAVMGYRLYVTSMGR